MRASEFLNIDCMDKDKGMPSYPDKIKKTLTPEERLARKRERNRKYYHKNKEKMLAGSKQYRQDHLEDYNRYRNEYRTKNPKGIYEVIKQGAKKRGIRFEIDKDDFVFWYEEEPKVCIYCGRTEADVIKDDDIIQNKAGRLTIDRLDNNKGYRLHNLGLCCRRCNTIKGNFFTQKEMMEIGKIIKAKYE